MIPASSIVAVAHAAGVIEDATPITTVIANAFSVVILSAGSIAMLSFTVAGILYVTAGGDEPRIRQAKNAMTYSVVGAIVCALALIVIRTVVNMV